jgi:DNA repair/transcription protein MET18/MMS19
LQTIQACISSYRLQVINLYSVTLWDALKFEILNVQEEDLADEALKALALIGLKFQHAADALNTYLRPIIKECNEHIEDAPTKQSQAAGRILHSVAASAQEPADKISRGVLPALLNLYTASESITKRRGLLEVYNQISKAYVDLSIQQGGVNVETLRQSSSDILGIMLRAITHAPRAEVSFRLTALTGVKQMLALRGHLSQDQSFQAVDAICDIVLRERTPGHGDIRSDAIKALIDMASTEPDAVRNRAIPAFMADLPDFPSNEDLSEYGIILEAFAQLSQDQQIFDTVVLRLKNKFAAAKAQSAPEQYCHALLLAILYAFAEGKPMTDEQGIPRSAYFTDYAAPLIESLKSSVAAEPDLVALEIISRLSNIVLRPQGVHFQSTVYSKNYDWVVSIRGETQQFAPFVLYYYSALRPEVVDPEDIMSWLKVQSAQLLDDTIASTTRQIHLRTISMLINKFIDPKTMASTLQSAGVEVERLLSPPSATQSATISFAVVKSLLVQGKASALTTKYLELLLQLLPMQDQAFARHFASLLAPDDILIKDNHCLVSGLYKQKTFNQLVPQIIIAVRTADPAAKPNYLIALSGVIRWLPYSMLEPSLTDLIAPLLQTLDLTESSDHEIKTSALVIFESILMHNPDLISEHIASLITRLLKCTSGPGHSAKVRAKALQCLALVPKQLKREVVMPYRREVTRKLWACLDDPKRDVRAEGVRARDAWYRLDDGGEDEE